MEQIALKTFMTQLNRLLDVRGGAEADEKNLAEGYTAKLNPEFIND